MFKHRLVSGLIIGLSAVAAALFLSAIGEWLVLVAISSLAQLEFYALAQRANIPSFRIIGLVAGAAIISVTFFAIGPQAGSMANTYRWDNIVLLCTLFAVFIRQFPQKYNDKPLETIACTLFGIWYVPFMFNFITRLAFTWSERTASAEVSDEGKWLMLFLIVVVKCTDIGAYLVGRLIGRHKLFPRISPNKTWEGFFGGILFGIFASWTFCHWTLPHYDLGPLKITWCDSILLGFLLAIAGTVGDLFESLLKRAAGAKDSSLLIPGLGGLLDVLDSLLFGAPALYAYITYMKYPLG